MTERSPRRAVLALKSSDTRPCPYQKLGIGLACDGVEQAQEFGWLHIQACGNEWEKHNRVGVPSGSPVFADKIANLIGALETEEAYDIKLLCQISPGDRRVDAFEDKIQWKICPHRQEYGVG